MGTSDQDELDDDGGRQTLAPYSTGLLNAAQAAAVEQWKARLHEDKPLPGVRKKGEVLRLVYHLDDRPACSLSDVIAAAVTELLEQKPPDSLDVARYACRTVREQRLIAVNGVTPESPVHKKVSFYLIAKTAAHWEMLRAAAFQRQRDEVKALHVEAEQRYPAGEQRKERAQWVWRQLNRLGLPEQPVKIPGGVIGRMAIDYVAKRRGVDRVVGDAVRYASEVHEQPHRARRDVHQRK
ncbi:hypothetical protein ACWCSD_36345 [Nonomuraea sp. NPDC001684]